MLDNVFHTLFGNTNAISLPIEWGELITEKVTLVYYFQRPLKIKQNVVDALSINLL